jgi:hypothetical protein
MYPMEGIVLRKVGSEVDPGLLTSILRDCELDRDEFMALL